MKDSPIIYSIEYDKENPSSAYGSHYFGYEMIFLVKKDERLRYFLIENKMALLGFWMNDAQVANVVMNLFKHSVKDGKLFLNIGDEIHIESFKHRNSTFNEEGHLLATADVVRVLNVVDTEKK